MQVHALLALRGGEGHRLLELRSEQHLLSVRQGPQRRRAVPAGEATAQEASALDQAEKETKKSTQIQRFRRHSEQPAHQPIANLATSADPEHEQKSEFTVLRPARRQGRALPLACK